MMHNLQAKIKTKTDNSSHSSESRTQDPGSPENHKTPEEGHPPKPLDMVEK